MGRKNRGHRDYDGHNSYDSSMNSRHSNPDAYNPSYRGGYSRRDSSNSPRRPPTGPARDRSNSPSRCPPTGPAKGRSNTPSRRPPTGLVRGRSNSPRRSPTASARGRSNTPPRRPPMGPARRHTVQEVNPLPMPSAAMPSPATSPSEADTSTDNRQTEKKSEKATDPRRRSKVGSSTPVPPPTEAPLSPATPSLPNLTLPAVPQTGSHIPGGSDPDLEMVDADLDTDLQQLIQTLTKLCDLNMRSGAHFGDFQRLGLQYKEKRRAKELAAEKFKDHPEYTKHVTLQESTAYDEFKKASKTKIELESAIQSCSTQFAGQLSVIIRKQRETKPKIPSPAVEKLQADLETLRSGLEKQNPELPSDILDQIKRLSDVLQATRSRLTEVEHNDKSFKLSVTTQVKAEIAEALRQIQIKSTSALTDCQNVKKDILETMTSAEEKWAKCDGDIRQLQEENTSLRQKIADLEANTVSRNELDKFKADMEKRYQAFYENSESVQPKAADLLAPYINSYNQNIQKLTTQVESNSTRITSITSQVESNSTRIKSVESQVESVTRDVAGKKIEADFLNRRLDGFNQDLGALRNQTDKLESRTPTFITTEPSAALGSLQKETQANTRRLDTAEKELQAQAHAYRALNSRYNNMTTEPLAQQIAAIVNPINANVLGDLAHTRRSISQLQQHQSDTSGKLTRFSQRLDDTEAKAVAASAMAETTSKLEGRVKTVELTALQIPNILKAFSEHEAQYIGDSAGVNSMAQSHQEEIDKIKKDLGDQKMASGELRGEVDNTKAELVTVQGSVMEMQKNYESLHQPVEDATEKLEQLRTSLQKLESVQGKATVAHSELLAEVNNLKDDARQENDSKNITMLADRLKGLETKRNDGESLPGIPQRVIRLEQAVEDVKSSLEEYSRTLNKHLDAFDGDIVKRFMTNSQSVDQDTITVRPSPLASTTSRETSSQINGNPGTDPDNDSQNDAKPTTKNSTGPRDLLAPNSGPLNAEQSPGGSAVVPRKRRNNSPGTSKTRNKRMRESSTQGSATQGSATRGSSSRGSSALGSSTREVSTPKPPVRAAIIRDAIDLTQSEDDFDAPQGKGPHNVPREREAAK